MGGFDDITNSFNNIFGHKNPSTGVVGIGGGPGVAQIRSDPAGVDEEYFRRARGLADASQRGAENAEFGQQRERILGGMAPNYAATEAAKQQAMQAGQATLGAARSQAGIGGMQVSALGALGAGAAQQYGMQGAAQVKAGEDYSNLVRQAQYAAMLQQQQQAQFGLQRADTATALGSERALMGAAADNQLKAAAAEAATQRALLGGGINALGSAFAAYGPAPAKKKDEDPNAYMSDPGF